MSLKVIATNLGLSITTVSRALGGHSDVSEPTKMRVEREAQRIGYVPNEMARRLQKGRADAIGFVVPGMPQSLDDPHFVEVMAGAWSRLEMHDLDFLVMSAIPGPSELRMYRRLVEGRRVDGLIVTRVRKDDPRLAYLAETRFPHVVIGNGPRDRHVVSFDIDRQQVADLIVGRLAEFNHRRIVCIGSDTTACTFERKQAVKDAALRHGMACVDLPTTGEDGEFERLASRLAFEYPDIAAVVTISGCEAAELVKAFRARGLTPGETLSVIGFGDCPANAFADPPITAVRLPIREMAARAVDTLLRVRDGLSTGEMPGWDGELIVRKSDGPAPELAAMRA
ncbi:MAG: LacI family DNA-binding transcriptional regulator [Ancalomicrobiaceae bacterium]|nr:LacI family DNA-binding transcriptional regulator [Ancalomicrobiaceae bacterium]